MILAAFVEASVSLGCFNQSGQLIENLTLENCCHLHNEFHCIALKYLKYTHGDVHDL